MSTLTKVLLSIIGAVTAALQIPTIHDVVATWLTSFFMLHGSIASIIGAIGAVLSLLHNPKPAA